MIKIDIETKIVIIEGTEKLLDIITIIESGAFGNNIEEWDIKSNIRGTTEVSYLDKCSKCPAFLLPSKDVPSYPKITYSSDDDTKMENDYSYFSIIF